jgi:membrane-associated phospholipid phosphatase
VTRFAALISRLSHPFLVPVPTLVAALRLDGVGWSAAIGWSLVCIAVGIVPPTLLLIVQRRRHGDRDWYVTVREQRFGLYALGLVCLVALILLARFGGAPRLLLPCLVAALGATAIGAALNRVTKVSVHMGAATGCALLLAHFAPKAALPLAAVVALVAWSRLRLAHHTPLQVMLGGAVAAICMALSLAVFGVS